MQTTAMSKKENGISFPHCCDISQEIQTHAGEYSEEHWSKREKFIFSDTTDKYYNVVFHLFCGN